MTADLVQTTVSQDYFDDILKSMFDTLIVSKPGCHDQSVNKRTCDVLGYGQMNWSVVRSPTSSLPTVPVGQGGSPACCPRPGQLPISSGP